MPDNSWKTVSASQSAALFGQSPYNTRFTLWHAFRSRDASLIEAADNERMDWGKRLQPCILRATAEEFRLELVENLVDAYDVSGPLGCTIDGHLVAPDVGEIIVEVKNVDWKIWADTWTETTAPPHIEIQMQHQLCVRNRPRGIIACLVGGNDLRFYERTASPEIWAQLWSEAESFLASVAAGEEPDPLGSPLEIPILSRLYVEADPDEILEAPDDDELANVIAQFDWAREQETFACKLKDQMKAKLLARAGTAGIVRAPGISAFISRSAIAPQICQPHDDMKILRRASVTTRIKTVRTEDARGIPQESFAA